MIRNYILRVLTKYASQWFVLTVDVLLILFSYVFAHFIRFNASFDFDKTLLVGQLTFIAILSVLSFILVGSYKGIIRHTGVRDAISVFVANLLIFITTIFLVALNRYIFLFEFLNIPISIVIIHYLVSTFVSIISRFVFKAFYEIISTDISEIKNVLIYGAGDSGLITFGALHKDKKENYEVKGFIDDDKNKIGKKIDRVRIYHFKEINQKFIENYYVNEVIISIQNLKPTKLLEITDYFERLELEIKIVPPLRKWIDGSLQASQIHQLKIEDLMDRSPINIYNPIVERDVSGKVILITGAAGSIGSEISRQLSDYKYKKLILVDQCESGLYDLQQELKLKGKNKIHSIVADIRDYIRMEYIFLEFKPNKVFHAAAYKHVPLMEENPYEAVKINVQGTKNIVDLSLKNKIERFVMISTDKAVNPTNIMGATKRIAEMYVSCASKQSTFTKFTTTRFGNVLGSRGSVIPLFKKQIENGGPLTVTHKEITRYFMTIPEACQLVLEAGTMGEGGEIYIFDMGKAIKIFDIAKKIIRLYGLEYPRDIDIQITGLRPGEKLYEELLADGEKPRFTYHNKIMISSIQNIDYQTVNYLINRLCQLNQDLFKKDEVVSLMKNIVPEFISNNSIYSEFDKKPVEVSQ